MSIVRNTQSPALTVLGDQLRLLLRSAASPHRMSVATVEVPPGAGVPPHSHAIEEEGYFVLGGTLTFWQDGAEHVLSPGDFAHVLPGAMHGYRNAGDESVCFLAWTVGGPIDEFFVAMSEEVKSMPEDAPRMERLLERYNISMG